jgi:hypothetical protein
MDIHRMSTPPECCTFVVGAICLFLLRKDQIRIYSDIHLFVKLKKFTREFLYPCRCRRTISAVTVKSLMTSIIHTAKWVWDGPEHADKKVEVLIDKMPRLWVFISHRCRAKIFYIKTQFRRLKGPKSNLAAYGYQ